MFVTPHALSVLLFAILLFYLGGRIKSGRQQRGSHAKAFPGMVYATVILTITEKASARL